MRDAQAEIPETSAEVRDDRVVVGAWSGSLTEMAQEATRLWALLTEGRAEEARHEMERRPVEEKTALVLASPPESREALLSLTGPDGKGYSPTVVNWLPTEILADLLVVDSDYLKYNVEILRAMSAERFSRAVADTMEPVYHWEHRQKVSWEWLEAVTALDDVDHQARLMASVDPALIEDALFGIVNLLGLDEVIGGIDGFPIKRYSIFSESGMGGPPPSAYIEDPKIGTVLDTLQQAAPDLFKEAIRGAWERARESGEESLDEETDEMEY